MVTGRILSFMKMSELDFYSHVFYDLGHDSDLDQDLDEVKINKTILVHETGRWILYITYTRTTIFAEQSSGPLKV